MKSKAQRGFLHANKPSVAKRFESETPRGKKLPNRVPKKGQKARKGY
jgi:hypothetical protein